MRHKIIFYRPCYPLFMSGKSSNSSPVNIELLTADQWARLRDIRLRALKENPEAFGAKYDEAVNFNEEEWKAGFLKEDYLVGSVGGVDVGMLYIEVLNGDHGATCWIGGCWTDIKFRGNGVMRALFDFINKHASEKGWQRQGLGVWTHNQLAIAAYESLGFSKVGEKMPSTSNPGMYFQHMVRGSI